MQEFETSVLRLCNLTEVLPVVGVAEARVICSLVVVFIFPGLLLLLFDFRGGAE